MKIIRTTNPRTEKFGLFSKELSQVVADFSTIDELEELVKYNIDDYEVVKMEYVDYD